MNNKTLGTLALIGAPFLLIGSFMEIKISALSNTWFTGLWGILYITPWMGSMIALHRAGALGTSRIGKAMPWILLTTLTIADISNIICLFGAQNKVPFFFYLDLFWPISHLLMLVVGIVAIRAGVLQGWKRYVPLAMGTWLPFALGTVAILGRTQTSFLIGGLYNAAVVILLALVVRNLPEKQDTAPEAAPQFQPVLQ